MSKTRNNIVWYLVVIYFITLIIPILLFITKPAFTISSLFDYLKDFSFTLWVLLFSCSWLYYKLIVKDNEHLRYIVNQPIPDNESGVVIDAIKQRNKDLEPRITKLENAELAIKNLELAIAVVGIIAGLIGVLSFLYKIITQ